MYTCSLSLSPVPLADGNPKSLTGIILTQQALQCVVTGACGLACRIEPIIMSAGELEHEWAGTPGRLIRERYRKAAEVSRVCAPVLSVTPFSALQPHAHLQHA